MTSLRRTSRTWRVSGDVGMATLEGSAVRSCPTGLGSVRTGRSRCNASDLEWFALLVGGDGAVVRCDPDCLGGVAGGLWPVPVRDAFEFVVGHLAFDHAAVAASSPSRQEPGQDLTDPVEQCVGYRAGGKRDLPCLAHGSGRRHVSRARGAARSGQDRATRRSILFRKGCRPVQDFFGPRCRPCDLGRAQTEAPLAQRAGGVSVGLNRIPVSAGGLARGADADELPLLVHAAPVRILDDAGPVGGGEARYLDGLPAVAVDQPDVSVR